MTISLEKYLTQVGIFPQNGERVFQKQQLTAAPRPPRSLGWGGEEGQVQDGGSTSEPAPDSCCTAETTTRQSKCPS